MTYSHLDLGERPFSRQSNPNIRSDLETHHWKRSRIKSAPATPRATTPTRIRSRNRDFEREDRLRHSVMNGNHSPEENIQGVRPTTATSVVSQETGYPDDYGSSIDSRSLGRDSALGPYMSHGYYGAYRDTPDRPNPFVQGTAVGKTIN